MTTGNPQRSILLFGGSQHVVDDCDAALRDLGYTAQGTNDFFSDITGRFDFTDIDLVSLGGRVPPDRKAELKQQIAAINPRVIFIEASSGIPARSPTRYRARSRPTDELRDSRARARPLRLPVFESRAPGFAAPASGQIRHESCLAGGIRRSVLGDRWAHSPCHSRCRARILARRRPSGIGIVSRDAPSRALCRRTIMMNDHDDRAAEHALLR